jgi:uncharacterized protein YqeY
MLITTVKKQITEAMKARDEIRLSTLKMLSAALTNAEIEKKREELSEGEELMVVKSEAKKRKDAIEMYKKLQDSKTQKLQAKENLEKEEKELKILQEFLPEEMSDEDLVRIVEEVLKESGVSSMADMGKVMGAVMGKVKGRASGDRVSELVQEKLK